MYAFPHPHFRTIIAILIVIELSFSVFFLETARKANDGEQQRWIHIQAKTTQKWTQQKQLPTTSRRQLYGFSFYRLIVPYSLARGHNPLEDYGCNLSRVLSEKGIIIKGVEMKLDVFEYLKEFMSNHQEVQRIAVVGFHYGMLRGWKCMH